jgi:hypothetical protein
LIDDDAYTTDASANKRMGMGNSKRYILEGKQATYRILSSPGCMLRHLLNLRVEMLIKQLDM